MNALAASNSGLVLEGKVTAKIAVIYHLLVRGPLQLILNEFSFADVPINNFSLTPL